MAGLTNAARILLATGFLLTASCQPQDAEPMSSVDGFAERIVSLSPHITELAFAAGAGDRLVGAVDYSDYPFEARTVPRVGDSFRIDYETISVLQPDLVLAWRSGNHAGIVLRLRELGFRVVELEAATLDDIAADLRTIGDLAGTGEIANQRADEFSTQLEKLRVEHMGVRTVRVFYQIAANPYFTITGRHAISSAIELCGGENVFADISGLAPAVSFEAVIAENPEVIIASVVPGDESWKQVWKDWNNVDAVSRTNLYSINPDVISRPGPRIIEGVARICKALNDAREKPFF